MVRKGKRILIFGISLLLIFSSPFEGGVAAVQCLLEYCKDWLRPGWLIRFDFKMSHNAASAEVALFLRNDLKNLRCILLKRILFFIDIKVTKRKKSTTLAGK